MAAKKAVKTTEKVLIYTDDLQTTDEIKVGGLYVVITRIEANSHDELVLHLGICGAIVKSRNKMTIIVPRKTPITVRRVA